MGQDWNDKEYQEDIDDILEEETSHAVGGWKNPQEEEALLQELDDIILSDEEEEDYQEEVRKRQFIAQERYRRHQRNKLGRVVGLAFSFVAVILLIGCSVLAIQGFKTNQSIKKLEKFQQTIEDTRQGADITYKVVKERVATQYEKGANVTEKTQAEIDAEKAAQIAAEEAKAREVAEAAAKAQAEANAKQQAATAAQQATQQQAVASEYILPSSSSVYLEESVVANMSAYDLYLARNEIYARHGRKFTNQDLKDYFASKSWYQPLYEPAVFDSWGTSVFNAVEIANIKLILSYEN